jgi:tungstate transport system substrate-binding protein
MATGVARERRLVMHNDFVIIGPREDPAGIEGAEASDAFRRIADDEAPFVSRGDDSGTHVFELKLWKQAGVKPAGAWYEETGQGMGPTLQVASQKQAYTLADRGTYLATEQGESLPILVEREPPLVNLYHVIDMTSDAGPRVNAEGGRAFADWIVSPGAQKTIGGFGKEKFGQPLFVPDAGKSEAEARREA